MEGIKPDIDVNEAKGLIDKFLGTQGFVLLDVRTTDEFLTSRIAGSVHLELSHLESKLHSLDKNSFYLVYCRSGRRSDSAANIMRVNGFKKVSNMLGGILAWTANNFGTVSGK
jgi:rhodanese-related sulfurtransferase